MKTRVLSHRQIEQKLDRIAYEIVENNSDADKLILVGIHGNGFQIAKDIGQRLAEISHQKVHIGELFIDKKKPLEHPIKLSFTADKTNHQTVILIDDVINSGRTMQYGLMKLLEHPLDRIKTVALVDRKHRKYPIRCNYVGLTLSTTLQERIEVELESERSAYLI